MQIDVLCSKCRKVVPFSIKASDKAEKPKVDEQVVAAIIKSGWSRFQLGYQCKECSNAKS